MKFTFALLASLAALYVPAANAAGVTWSQVDTISGDSDVSTTGTLDRAYTFGTGNTAIVNGVTFTPIEDSSDEASFFASTGSDFGSSSSPFSDLSANYQDILAGGYFLEGGSFNVYLHNLTPGTTYQLQTWINDSRSEGIDRFGFVSSFDDQASSAELSYNVNSSIGGVGQYAVGTFTADSSTQVLLYYVESAFERSQVNALQLRVVPEPASLTLLASASATALALGLWRFRAVG